MAEKFERTLLVVHPYHGSVEISFDQLFDISVVHGAVAHVQNLLRHRAIS